MTRLQRALVALVAVALLGACTDDDPEPKVEDPTPSVSSEPTESVSTSPTSSPVATLSPRETVDAWLAAWTVAMQTGDTTAVAQLSSTGCGSCHRLIDKVDEVYGKGGRYETVGWKASHVNEAPGSVDTTPSFVMQVRQAERSLFNAAGELVDTEDEATAPVRMTFISLDGVWLLDGLEILE